MGGNVRVGLETAWLGPGKLAESNAAQVRNAVQIIHGLASSRHARRGARDLELKGGDQVGLESRVMASTTR